MDEAIDAISDSWCSVHFPPSQVVEATNRPVPASAKADWVADWLTSLQNNTKLHSVHYEPQTSQHQQQSLLCAVDLNEAASSSNSSEYRKPQRSLSDASLADFLKCRGSCRPSFLDHKSSYREPKMRAKLSASESEVSCPKSRSAWKSVAKRAQCQQQYRRHVGWVAKRLDKSSLCESQEDVYCIGDKTNKEASLNCMSSGIKSRERVMNGADSVNPSSIATAEGSAEFLSHAIHHFVAFQPLDFVPRSPVPPAGSVSTDTDVSLANTAVSVASAGLANIRSYFSGIMDEFSREDAVFIQ
ncbi:hypothetical protein IWW36_003185 [Coemansia brasiliensis]|uniref:Uncharacterized protein n=1 Tax=Coemansia brasiliensis TaxID=2650707 RepID=A0A9W8IAM2_9FUNG|nr:hypothetical protein IWW36_003185 [Coemansia brasiliensis]